MELVLAAVVGGVIGYVIGRAGGRGDRPAAMGDRADAAPMSTVDRINRRLTKRQQRILDTLPDDDPRPTIEDLIAEEAHELGVDEIPADDEIELGIRLAVYKRDSDRFGDSSPTALRYVVRSGATAPFEADDVYLVSTDRDAT